MNNKNPVLAMIEKSYKKKIHQDATLHIYIRVCLTNYLRANDEKKKKRTNKQTNKHTQVH